MDRDIKKAASGFGWVWLGLAAGYLAGYEARAPLAEQYAVVSQLGTLLVWAAGAVAVLAGLYVVGFLGFFLLFPPLQSAWLARREAANRQEGPRS